MYRNAEYSVLRCRALLNLDLAPMHRSTLYEEPCTKQWSVRESYVHLRWRTFLDLSITSTHYVTETVLVQTRTQICMYSFHY